MVYQSVDRGGGCPDLSEPQTFKNVSLQMTVYRAYTFRHKFYKKFTPFKVLMFVMNGQSGNGSGTHLPLPQKFAAFTASISSFRFHVPGFALIISMPRFTSTNFYQTRPKIKLL